MYVVSVGMARTGIDTVLCIILCNQIFNRDCCKNSALSGHKRGHTQFGNTCVACVACVNFIFPACSIGNIHVETWDSLPLCFACVLMLTMSACIIRISVIIDCCISFMSFCNDTTCSPNAIC